MATNEGSSGFASANACWNACDAARYAASTAASVGLTVEAGEVVDTGELGRVVAAGFADFDVPPPHAANPMASTTTRSVAPKWDEVRRASP